MLPLLFLISALSTGMMAVILFGSLAAAAKHTLIMLEKIDVTLIILELIVLAFYLQGTHRVPESRESARIVMAGALAPLFWFGVVIIGLLAPLGLDLLGLYSLQGSAVQGVTLLASVFGLIGGFLLRKVVLSGGIHAPLVAGRFEYGLTNV
jgi:formate-dependent nitrite reductase membrane component NrfD